MAEETNVNQAMPSNYVQLTQTRVPLDQAAAAFSTPDANGRMPIVVIPDNPSRVNYQLIGAAAILVMVAWLIDYFVEGSSLFILSIPVALVLVGLGIYRSFIVRVPEGANALLARGTRYDRTIGSGTTYVLPWISVSHMVTRREIPFDVPVVEAPSQDNVRISLDTLVTFAITDPYRFVYSISADDFDQVFQATCQDELRALVRSITSDELFDMSQDELIRFQDVLSADMESYGITINKVTVPYALPPAEFMQSLEKRKLAAVQQEEQAQQQALAQRRQADAEALKRQEVLARLEREREELQMQVQQAEARRRVVELEAETEAMRLARLEERLRTYPLAAQYEWESAQLDVARQLAGNTRAVVQFGEADDISKAIVRSELMRLSPREVEVAAETT